MTLPPVDILHSGPFTLAVANHGEVRTFTRRGVADLAGLLETDPGFLHGSAVADKVVGRAAAALMILGGVERLHTRVISRHALSLLDESDMHVQWDEVTAHVINRTGDGWCPLETLCRELATPQQCYAAIRKFLYNG